MGRTGPADGESPPEALHKPYEKRREETAPQDLPGELWHALSQLQHTHPAPVGRVGPLARPVGLLSFAASTDTVLAARVQLSGAETMHELNETLRSITGGMHAHFTGPGVALEVTLGRRQELPIHAAHTAGLTRLSATPLAPSVPAARREAAGASTATGPGVLARCGSQRPGKPEQPPGTSPVRGNRRLVASADAAVPVSILPG